MKYEKPIVMDLGERVRRVNGDNHIDVCYPGAQANHVIYDPCTTGGIVAQGEVCVGGGNPYFHKTNECVAGDNPGAGYDCYSGGTPYACSAGDSPEDAYVR